jgi:hypothetical protein
MATSSAPAHDDGRSRFLGDPLRAAAAVFAVALLVHAVDHLRRGMDVVTDEVRWAGNIQLALAVLTLALVFTEHRAAPVMAIVVGFGSAIGFTAAHLLPEWSAFSDSFTDAQVAPHVTWFSWLAALFEIFADVLLGAAGVHALRASTRTVAAR